MTTTRRRKSKVVDKRRWGTVVVAEGLEATGALLPKTSHLSIERAMKININF